MCAAPYSRTYYLTKNQFFMSCSGRKGGSRALPPYSRTYHLTKNQLLASYAVFNNVNSSCEIYVIKMERTHTVVYLNIHNKYISHIIP